MSLVPSAVVPPPAAERPPARAGNRAQWLIAGCYLLAAVAVTWRLWADPAARAQAGDTADVDLFAWFLRYDAVAVAHGHLPALFTTAMNAPRGINLMWNTSFLLPGPAASRLRILHRLRAGNALARLPAETLARKRPAVPIGMVDRRRHQHRRRRPPVRHLGHPDRRRRHRLAHLLRGRRRSGCPR